MMDKLKSRKLWVTILAAAGLGTEAGLDLTSDPYVTLGMSMVVSVYLIMQGIVDKNSNPTQIAELKTENENLLSALERLANRNANQKLYKES